jgi:hypothetical protein
MSAMPLAPFVVVDCSAMLVDTTVTEVTGLGTCTAQEVGRSPVLD